MSSDAKSQLPEGAGLQPPSVSAAREAAGGATRNARASDVARRAQLSRAQVSNYFNNPDLVSADARQRISAAIAELGYVRDEAASALRRGTTQMLGLLLLDGWAPYFAQLSQAIDDEADRRGWYLQVANSSRNENREMRHLNYFEAYRTRGIIVAPQGDISTRLEQLAQRGMVCVLLDPPRNHPAPDAIPSIAVDHVNGGSLAAQHLLDRGSRRFAFVGNTADKHSQDRLAGFTTTIRQSRPDVAVDVIETTDLTMGAATPAADHLVRLPAAERPDGILASNDLVAIGLLHSLTNKGLNIPHDIRLVGYDDIDIAAELATPLSTIRQPIQQLGSTAVRLVIEQIEGTSSGEAPHIELQPELVVRATT